MKKGHVIFFTVLIIFCGLMGIFCRGKYTDVLADYVKTGDAGEYMVSNVMFDDLDYAREIIETGKNILNSADYVVKAEVVDTPRSILFSTMWRLKVKAVYRGKDIQEGQQITYVTVNADYSKEQKIWGRSYTNLMKAGEEYLVFMNGSRRDSKGERIYISPQDCDFRYFALTEKKNVVVPEECKKLDRRYYLNTVKDNEFFAESRDVMDEMEAFKEEILHTYLSRDS